MKTKMFNLFVSALLFTTIFSVAVSANMKLENTITVNNVTGDYSSIQDAIDDANEGDTIFVSSFGFGAKFNSYNFPSASGLVD